MERQEIIAGLSHAIERGYTLELAIQSFINAGYSRQDVMDSAKIIGGGVMQNYPILEHEDMPQVQQTSQQIQQTTQQAEMQSPQMPQIPSPPPIARPTQQPPAIQPSSPPPIQQPTYSPPTTQQPPAIQQYPSIQPPRPPFPNMPVYHQNQSQEKGRVFIIILVVFLVILLGVLGVMIFAQDFVRGLLTNLGF